MTLYLCTRSALTSHICRTALAGKIPFSSIPDLDVHTITGLSALADGILLDGSEFSREELGIIFTKADRQCRMVLLAESPLMEACMQEFRERACCLNILAPSGELQKKLAALFDGGRAGKVTCSKQRAAAFFCKAGGKLVRRSGFARAV